MCYRGVLFGWVVLVLVRVFDNGFHEGSGVVDVEVSILDSGGVVGGSLCGCVCLKVGCGD